MLGPPKNETLVWGWVGKPNDRGTLDILYSSVATIYLCTWTCLCLNIPRPYKHHWRFLTYKLTWQMFAIFFPEVLVAVAAEQWLSARQSVPIFAQLGHPEWTIRHGFYADMGGIMLKSPDYDMFPINSQQLAFLVKNNYLDMPDIDTQDIADVNKLDELARAITLVQIGYFTVQSIARGIQNIGLSPLELTTLAFIMCTLHTFIFWYHKPLDPYKPRVVEMKKPISEILAIERRSADYVHTPLEFVIPPPDRKSLTAPFWFGLECCCNFFRGPVQKPKKTLPNSQARPPNGNGWLLTLYLLAFQMMYYGLHIGAGWNMSFPTQQESILWVAANFAEFGLIAVYVLSLPLGANENFCRFAAQFAFKKDASSILEVAAMLPFWAQLLVHGPFVYGYILARVSVLTESFICLRALPSELYKDVNWTQFMPHV